LAALAVYRGHPVAMARPIGSPARTGVRAQHQSTSAPMRVPPALGEAPDTETPAVRDWKRSGRWVAGLFGREARCPQRVVNVHRAPRAWPSRRQSVWLGRDCAFAPGMTQARVSAKTRRPAAAWVRTPAGTAPPPTRRKTGSGAAPRPCLTPPESASLAAPVDGVIWRPVSCVCMGSLPVEVSGFLTDGRWGGTLLSIVSPGS